MSQITTHILDTSSGIPAENVTIILYRGGNDNWSEIGRGITDSDGRAKELLKGSVSAEGIFKLRFETKDYFDKKKMSTFYPYVEIIFEVASSQHYHVPLLLNPFGYSTYRGS